MSPRDRLTTALAPELVEALEGLVAERVAAELARRKASGPEWLTLDAAAERLGCSPDAVRMRANRGRLDTRHHGRRVYVSAASVATLALWFTSLPLHLRRGFLLAATASGSRSACSATGFASGCHFRTRARWALRRPLQSPRNRPDG